MRQMEYAVAPGAYETPPGNVGHRFPSPANNADVDGCENQVKQKSSGAPSGNNTIVKGSNNQIRQSAGLDNSKRRRWLQS